MGANDPMKRIHTIQNTMKSIQASPTAKKNIRVTEPTFFRNKSVNVSNRVNAEFNSPTASPVRDNDYDAPPVSQ